MAMIRAQVYSCNKLTYKNIYKDAVKRAYLKDGISIDENDIFLQVIDLSANGTKEIQQQRSPSGEHCRVIQVIENDELKYIIGVSNTNFDEDIRVERIKTKRKNVYGKDNYHANTYMIQGINKIFARYFESTKKYTNVKLFFYLLDINQTYPHNKFNLFTYRELSTLGFDILNIDQISFSQFYEYGFRPNSTCSNISYSSFNKLMNDKLAIFARNSGNIPAYLQCVETEEEDGTIVTEKYIYKFKALGAQSYDSCITMWTLDKLAKKENKNLEFLLTLEHYGFRKNDKNVKITNDLTKPVKELLSLIGVNIDYETDDEILQERNKMLSAFEKAKKNNELRNQTLFRNNLRKKGIQTKCAICGCDIENILEAAHIWGISQIKDESGRIINKVLEIDCMHDLIDFSNPYSNDIFYKKYVLANSGDNGIWLCSNHHGMFDNNLFCFDSEYGKIIICHEDYEKIKQQLRIENDDILLSDDILTEKTKVFLYKRVEEFLKLQI
ncbi:HNH endonuclease signature motif containing protein [Mycoplasmopsis arginini]|uniref:HNH endonuclease signature motif containing protein n=1 Tax=Mycoplasmopsis arginini TaxID=2094 RepID=UPI00249DA601|nr:HNH endonuclease signature motif containing protein [Mycoplasmopsis arginini]MDI3348258.1 hypothetical protein [Mycoplasmopsis arginini]